jgi:prepilin-type N-terminal cleavage/methylation domain-containing protein
MTRRVRGKGFTLIEVLVALVIGGMAVAGAAALFSSLADRINAIDQAAARADYAANAEHVLTALVGNLIAGGDSMAIFVGDSNAVRFRAWCEVPAGWLERRSLRLTFDESPDGTSRLLLDVEGMPNTTELRRGFRHGGLRYLGSIESRLTWLHSWPYPVPPRAIAVIVDADTLVLPVSGGG